MSESTPSTADELALHDLDAGTRRLVEQVRATGRPLRITEDGASTAVLLDAAAYEEQQRRLTLMEHLAHGRKDLDEGRTLTQEQVEALLEEWLPDSG